MLYRKTTQGKSLTLLLEKNNIKKIELAKRLNLDKSYLTKIEKEQYTIPERTYNRILNELT